MTSLSDMDQKKWIYALRRLGLIVSTNRGKGSHMRIYDASHPDRTMTIPNHLNPITNKKIQKQLLSWGFTEKEISKALK